VARPDAVNPCRYAPRYIKMIPSTVFMQIAAMASEREISDIVAADVLTRDNVFDLMRYRAMLLAKPTVLATISGPVANKEPDPRTHCY